MLGFKNQLLYNLENKETIYNMFLYKDREPITRLTG